MRLSHFLSFIFVWNVPFCQITADKEEAGKMGQTRFLSVA